MAKRKNENVEAARVPKAVKSRKEESAPVTKQAVKKTAVQSKAGAANGKAVASKSKAAAPTPPITPPTMAPTSLRFFGVLVGEGPRVVLVLEIFVMAT